MATARRSNNAPIDSDQLLTLFGFEQTEEHLGATAKKNLQDAILNLKSVIQVPSIIAFEID
jgi:hypothetical protein